MSQSLAVGSVQSIPNLSRQNLQQQSSNSSENSNNRPSIQNHVQPRNSTNANNNNNNNNLTAEQQEEKVYNMWVLQSVFAILLVWVISSAFILSILFPDQIHYSVTPAIYILYYIIAIVKNHKIIKENLDEEPSHKLMRRYELVEYYFLMLLGILAILKLTFKEVLPYYLLPFLLVCVLIRYKIYTISTKNGDCIYIWDFGMIGFRLFYCIQFFSIAMKYDDIFTWEWKEIFWPFWVFFAINIGIIFAILLMVVSKICQYCAKEIHLFEVKGILWMFLIISIHTGIFCFIILGLVDYLDNDNKNVLVNSLFSNCGCASFMILLTLLLKKDIKLFMKLVIAEENGTVDNANPTNANNGNNTYNTRRFRSSRKNKVKKELKQIDLMGQIPRYLSKQSETYFKKIEGVMGQSPVQEPVKKRVKSDVYKLPSCLNESQTNNINNQNNNNNNKSNMMITTENEIPSENQKRNSKQVSQQNLNQRNSINNNKKKTTRRIKHRLSTQIKQPNISNQYYDSANSKFTINSLNDLAQISNNIINKDKDQKKAKQSLQDLDQKEIYDQINVNKLSEYQKAHFSMLNSERIPKKDHIKLQTQICDTERVFEKSQIRKVSADDSNSIYNGSVTNNTKTDSKEEQEQQMCLICFDRPQNSVFMNCCHGGICYECAIETCNMTGKCYLCREPIKEILQVDIKTNNDKYYKVISTTLLIEQEM